MATRTFTIFGILVTAMLPGVAQAHIGHLGEVAGHSHWVGVAALAGAAAIAGAVALKAKRRRAQETEAAEPASEPAIEAAEG